MSLMFVLRYGMRKAAKMLWREGEHGWALTVVAGICTIYVIRKVYQETQRRRLRKEWDGTGQDVVLLHQFRRGRFCPNLSPFALKVEAFLRLANIKYKIDEETPFGPKGKCPWITINKDDIADSEMVLDDLTERFSVQLDSRLEAREAAVVESARVLADEHLFWCVIAWRYWLDGCKTFLKTQTFGRFLRFVFPLFLKRGTKNRSKEQGLGVHSPEEIYQICKKDCNTLAGILGDRPFFGGENPCRADCGVFGQLAQLMWNAPGTRYEALLTVDNPSLALYCFRMKDKVFPDWDDLLAHPI